MKQLVTILILPGLATLLVWGFLAGHQEAGRERERESPIKAPSRVSILNGEVIVSLDEVAMEKSAITVAPVEPATRRRQMRAYGTVIDLQEFSDLRSNLLKATASANASREEFERLQTLHADARTASDKAVQDAEATGRVDAATLEGIEAQARQRWGDVIAKWVKENAPEFQRLLQFQDVLVQVSLPSDLSLTLPPRTASVLTSGGNLVPARFVSRGLRSDPRLQGQSFFYTATAEGSGLLPGMTTVALLPAGDEMKGVVVPGAAAVWSQGKLWVYAQVKHGQFTRRKIAADFPLEGGWFVTKDLAAGEHIVNAGAELLLSEEFRTQIQVGED